MDSKITNVIGVPIPQWLVEQFRVRAEKGTTGAPRDNQELLFYANKTAWVRMVSSVNVSESDLNYFNNGILKNSIDKANIKDPTSLAKSFMLFAGTSKYEKNGDQYSQTLRTGLDGGSYGMLGKDEVASYGYVPMPGIISVNVETLGKMGSVRSATVNFKVFNKFQLDIIDALYFKLGYTMLLEWGHTYYYKTLPETKDKDLKLYSTEELMIDPFVDSMTKEKLHYQISMNVKKSYGNYDGMLGLVTNFNFSRKEDGSYDCSVKMIAIGALAESLKVNRSEVYTNLLKGEIAALVSYENKQIQKQIAAEIAKAKKDYDAGIAAIDEEVKKRQLTLVTLDNYFQDRINKSTVASKLINQYYYYSSKKETDIVFQPDNTWALRRFGTLLTPNTVINEISILPDNNFSNYANGYKRNPKYSGIRNLLTEVRQFLTNNYDDNSEPEFLEFKITSVNDFTFTVESNSKWVELIGLDTDKWTPYVTFKKVEDRFYYYVIVVENVPITNVTTSTVAGSPNTGTVVTSKQFGDDLSKIKAEVMIHAIGATGDPDALKIKDPGRVKIVFGYDFNDNFNNFSRYNPYLVIKNNIKADNLSDSSLKKYTQVSDGLDYYIITNDSSYIESISIQANDNQAIIKEYADLNKEFQDAVEERKSGPKGIYDERIRQIKENFPTINIDDAQKDEAGKFSTAIEVALRSIQIYSLNKSGQETDKVVTVDWLLQDNKKLASALLNEPGLYKPYYEKVIGDQPFENLNIKYGSKDSILDVKNKQLLEFYIKYGFNHNLLSNTHSTIDPDPMKNVIGTEVDHKQFLQSYVLPFRVNQEFSQGVILDRPVYIKLGTLFMLINHIALMYDAKSADSKERTPMFYVDYNPNTNYCLTSPNHLSTNPTNFVIPYSGNVDEFKKLFDKETLEKIKGDIFDNAIHDKISQSLKTSAPFMENPIGKGLFRGKLMNVLVDIDYLLTSMKGFSTQDNTNSVYFKSFAESIISDLCKALGNYNLLRLAYTDPGNCYYIVDDQLVPPSEKEGVIYTQTENKYELPLHGKTSISKNLEIKTEISSRLANMIAVSANSPKTQATMGVDATSFGFFNKNFTDRYIPERADAVSETVSQTEKTRSIPPNDGDIQSAKKFNEAIKTFYGGTLQADYIGGATNYYMSRMSKIKAENPATRASAIIPVSVNFTTDGISGFYMYQSFTINEELLPYTYATKNKDEEGIVKKVGFVVVGLSHTIEANVWNTSVRANMIYLRNKEDYSKQKTTNVTYAPSPSIPAASTPSVRIYKGACSDYSGATQVPEGEYVGTDNFHKHYPTAPGAKLFIKYKSNINLNALGLTPLSESEIVDDTKQNKFKMEAYSRKPPYFVMHHTAGFEKRAEDVYTTFYCRGLPAQYVIERGGAIHRFLPDGMKGAHAKDVNSRAIGVEIVAASDSGVNAVLPVQINSAIRLAHYLGYNVENIVGHGKIQSNKEPDEGYSVIIKINPFYTKGYDATLRRLVQSS